MNAKELFKITSRAGRIIAIIVGIATGFSTIAGVIWNLYEFANSTREKTKSSQISQLTSYTNFGELIRHYRQIEKKTDDFMRTYRDRHWDREALLKQYTSGSSIYYSQEFKEFREIREFYEEVGTLVRFKALDFELVFQVIIFPSDFYEKTRPLRKIISEHWFESRVFQNECQLKDFGFNMEQLSKNYERRRNNQPIQWDER